MTPFEIVGRKGLVTRLLFYQQILNLRQVFLYRKTFRAIASKLLLGAREGTSCR